MDQLFTTWRDLLPDFLRVCEDSDEQTQGKRIDDALKLLHFVKEISPENIALVERLLSAEAYESAAIALLKGDTGFTVRRAPDGVFSASIILSGQAEGTTATGTTFALALLKAKTLALIADRN